jgi:hypothetical protein
MKRNHVVAGGGDVSRDDMLKQLVKDPAVVLDHKQQMKEVADRLQSVLSINLPPKSEEQLEAFKEKLATAPDMKTLMRNIYSDSQAADSMMRMFTTVMTTEVADIDPRRGPLSDFPPSVNANMYVDIVQYGLDNCPTTMGVVANMVVRQGKTITIKDVLVIANNFANLLFAKNRNLDALVKMRSLSLQVGGTSDLALDLLSDVGLAHSARSLNNLRDRFADVGQELLLLIDPGKPSQYVFDNCDFQRENLTVKVTVKEETDTRHLDTEPKTKEEALRMFKMDELLLAMEVNKPEKNHLLRNVLAPGFGRVLADRRPERAGKLAKLLPKHHKHLHSGATVKPAVFSVAKTYPFTETKHSDMIQLVLRVQKEHLREVARYMGDHPEFHAKLAVLTDKDAPVEVREAAEAEVQFACRLFGEFVGHGDLLTVQMWQEAKLLLAQEVTAFGRLEFCGPFRLEGFHAKMKKTHLDFVAMMRNPVHRVRTATIVFPGQWGGGGAKLLPIL